MVLRLPTDEEELDGLVPTLLLGLEMREDRRDLGKAWTRLRKADEGGQKDWLELVLLLLLFWDDWMVDQDG